MITHPPFDSLYGTGPVLHSLLTCSNSWSKDTIKILKLLIDYKADVKSNDYYERTPLHQAAFGWGEDIIELLIDSGAKVNVLDNQQRTPYDCLVKTFD
jgi:ankyrin repeat protein